MTDEQKAVLRKIIYAVETGGQVYGKCRYDDFTEAYTNSATEHAITIGAGQWYAGEAKRLLDTILKAAASTFRACDYAGIEKDLQTADWSRYKVTSGSEKARCIQRIISSSVGIVCQDQLLDQQMQAYCYEAEKLGVTDPKAQAMCANFRHQGGYSAVKRILAKTAKPYTLDNLYAACRSDTGNQVGAYKARQKFVYETLVKYFPEETEVKGMTKTEMAISQMESWAKDNSHGYDQAYRWGEKGDYDCSSSIFQAWENAGVPVKTQALAEDKCAYTGNMKKIFTKNGFVDVTKEVDLKTGAGCLRGDILLNTAHHVAMYCGDGKEVEASINEKGTARGGTPGDQTGKEFLIRAYRNFPWDYVLRYKGDKSVKSTANTAVKEGTNYMFSVTTVKQGSKGKDVTLLQTLLKAAGCKGADNKALVIDGDAGNNTVAAIKKYQKKKKLAQDGEAGPITWAAILLR